MSPRLRTWPKALHRLLINIDIDGRRPLSTPQRPLSLRGGNRSSCPKAVIARSGATKQSRCPRLRFVWIATVPTAPRDDTRGGFVFMHEDRPRVGGKLAITPGDSAQLDESRLRARR